MYNFKYGYIYKITNLINGKIYIGQVYNKSIIDRFNRHCDGASSNSRSYLGRAIYKYGKDNFKVEQIEECYSVQELNEREKYWIAYYNSTNGSIGYNLTPGGEGGNTYMRLSEKDLNKIKSKISKANKGRNNGNSVQIKCKSVKTCEEHYFNTIEEAKNFFKVKNSGIFKSRALHECNTLFRDEWLIAFENDEYKNYEFHKEYCTRGTKVKLTNLDTNEEIIFGSRNRLYKYLNLNNRLKFPTKIIQYKHYQLELLN